MKYNEKSCVGKNQNQISATIEQINNYTQMVVKGMIACILPPCHQCELDSQYFKRHDKRQRKFYAVADQIVHVICGLLIRFKCPSCNKTFTQYPDFAIPYKRYTRPTIEFFSRQYTENDQATYRKVRMQTILGYNDSEKQMEHSTIYRWISTIGKYEKIVARATDLILQAKPLSSICRDLANLSISRKKYRSNQRKQLLIGCRKLFCIEKLYRMIFNVSIFPKLATRCRFS